MWRNHRASIKNQLAIRCVPCAVAHVCAFAQKALLAAPSENGIDDERCFKVFVSENAVDDGAESSWDFPCLLHDSMAPEVQQFVAMLRQQVEEDKVEIQSKSRELQNFVESREDTHAAGTCSKKSNTLLKDVLPGLSKKIYSEGDSQVPYLKHMLTMAENGKFDCGKIAMPLAGLGQVLICHSGVMCVVVLPPKLCEQAGVDIGLFLKSADWKFCEEAPMFSLTPLEILWVPDGHFPLIVGMVKDSGITLKSRRGNGVSWPIIGHGKRGKD